MAVYRSIRTLTVPEAFYDRDRDELRDFTRDYWLHCEPDAIPSPEFAAAVEAVETWRFRPRFPTPSPVLRTWGAHPLCAIYLQRWLRDPERGVDEPATERALWALGRHAAACEACRRGLCDLGDRLEVVVRYAFERIGKRWP